MGEKIENITEKTCFLKNHEYAIKAREYLNRILYGIECYHGHKAKPAIVMSMDIFDILVAFTRTIETHINGDITCYGYDVKIVNGRNALYIAYDIGGIL